MLMFEIVREIAAQLPSRWTWLTRPHLGTAARLELGTNDVLRDFVKDFSECHSRQLVIRRAFRWFRYRE